MRVFFGIFISLAFLACSVTTTLESGAEKVQIVSEKPKGECRRLGEVEGYKYNLGPSLNLREIQNSARNDLKNNSLKLGANVVEIISTDVIKAEFLEKPREYHIQGIAYKCK